jgi:hypothetical protein
VAVTYDCVNGSCIDPGTGNGTYASLTACQSNCVSSSIITYDIDDLNIYPNPTSKLINIEFSIFRNQDIKFSLLNTIGEVIYLEALINYSGEFKRVINLDKYGKGVYLLEIQTTEGIIIKKLILQ